MKKITKYLMVAVLMMASVSLVACSKDDDNKTNEETFVASGSYVIHYMNRTLEPGQTVYHNVTDAEKEADEAMDDFYIENLRDVLLGTRFRVELVSGPASMKELPVCYGQCKPVTCPYTSDEFYLARGVDSHPLEIHCYPREHEAGSVGTYRITVGVGEALDDPQVFFLQFSL